MEWVRNYLNKPWVSGGRGPEQFDCWGLFRDVYKTQLGLDLPVFQIDPANTRQTCREFAAAVKSHTWNRVEKPQHLDAVALGTHTTVHHVGVFLDVDGGLVLHCNKPRVVAVPLNRLRMQGYQLIRFYRHAHNFRDHQSI